MITSLIKSAMVVVETPVAVVADVVTLGGVLTDKEQSYTAETAEKFVKNVSNITELD